MGDSLRDVHRDFAKAFIELNPACLEDPPRRRYGSECTHFAWVNEDAYRGRCLLGNFEDGYGKADCFACDGLTPRSGDTTPDHPVGSLD
jgi:hypothetical protein